MSLNPEFHRNLWLELRLHRLLAMPAVIALVTALLVSLDDSLSTLRIVAISAYFGVVFLWGSRRASAALADEVNARTWDMQRMTALGAWSMAWGKLFGGTAYIWYGGLQILAVLLYANVASRTLTLETALLDAATKVAGGVLVQASALAVALVLLAKQPRGGSLPVTFSQMIGLLAALAMVNLPELGITMLPAWFQSSSDIWYGISGSGESFALATVTAFAAWAVFAVYRLLRGELQFESLPWGWPLFTLFVIVYLRGFLPEPDLGALEPWLLIGFPVSLLATYVGIFADGNGVLRYRALLASLAAGRGAQALRRLPRWLPSFILLACFASLLLMGSDFTFFALGERVAVGLGQELAHLSRLWVLAAVLFALRDIFVVLLLNAWGRRYRRPDLTAFIYLLVLYGPALWLLQLIAPQIASLLVAIPVQSSLFSLISALAQAAVLLFLLLHAWRRPVAAPNPAGGS